MNVEGQGDDFDIQVGVGGPERLQAELEMLAVTALLGVLVAEGRGASTTPSRAGTGWCCTKARTMDAVPSGRRAMT